MTQRLLWPWRGHRVDSSFGWRIKNPWTSELRRPASTPTTDAGVLWIGCKYWTRTEGWTIWVRYILRKRKRRACRIVDCDLFQRVLVSDKCINPETDNEIQKPRSFHVSLYSCMQSSTWSDRTPRSTHLQFYIIYIRTLSIIQYICFVLRTERRWPTSWADRDHTLKRDPDTGQRRARQERSRWPASIKNQSEHHLSHWRRSLRAWSPPKELEVHGYHA